MIPRRKIHVEEGDFRAWIKAVCTRNTGLDIEVEKFENAFSSALNCRHALATASGRDTILLALSALGVGPGDEIIIPAYTLGELVPLLQKRGFLPVPSDVDMDSFTLDIKALEQKITKRTRAILATHLFGAPCDIVSICALARSSGIFVIEDCAHSAGAVVDGRQTGTIGDVGIFSLEANKPISCYGGGMLVTNNDAVFKKINTRLKERERGRWSPLKKTLSCWQEELLIRSPAYGIIARTIFSRTFASAFERFYRGSHDRKRKELGFSPFQARVAQSRLERLAERNRTLNGRWDQLAERFPKGFRVQNRSKFGTPAFYNFVALSPVDPWKVRKMAFSLGIDVAIGSEVMDDCAQILGDKCPGSRYISRNAILVPLYENLSEQEFEKVVSGFEKISGRLFT